VLAPAAVGVIPNCAFQIVKSAPLTIWSPLASPCALVAPAVAPLPRCQAKKSAPSTSSSSSKSALSVAAAVAVMLSSWN
jgi:hypothetical protein